MIKQLKEEQKIEKESKFYLIITLEQSCKFLNALGVKVSSIGNYVLVFYKDEYLIMSR